LAFFVEVIEMIVMLPPDIEKKLIALAAQRSVDPASLVASFVEKELNNGELALAPVADAGQDDDFDPDALNRAIAAIANRTPEQIKAAQEKIIKESTPSIELPPGVSAQDVWEGMSGDNQDDEDDTAALNRVLAETTNRTLEQIEATRAEMLTVIPEPLPIPDGKTVFDMFFRIRGRETDEQVYQALERLS
jgi:hypothetical protein